MSIAYYALFATTQAVSRLRSSGLFDIVECIFEINSDFRAFSENSVFYSAPIDGISRENALLVALCYGGRLVPNAPLGYGNGQFIIGFEHNTPDNTLPIFWYPEGMQPRWIAPFPRHLK